MLMKKHLTDERHQKLKNIQSKSGHGIDDLIRSGMKNPDSHVGIYAADASCYDIFSEVFHPIIEEYHGVNILDQQPVDLSSMNVETFSNPDPSGQYVVSTRIRVGRNIDGVPFPPGVTADQRQQIAVLAVKSFEQFSGNLAGEYFPLSMMSKAKQNELIRAHLLFKEGDRFLEAAGCNRDWPDSRGIYISADRKFLIWVNEEDSLRIIAIQDGADIAAVFNRLTRAIQMISKQVSFAYSPKLGFLSSCPSNLGTSMRASVHIRLPKISKQSDFKEKCADMGLSVRGTHGEFTESEGGVFDVSNTARFGLSEKDCATVLYDGVVQLIKMERAAE